MKIGKDIFQITKKFTHATSMESLAKHDVIGY